MSFSLQFLHWQQLSSPLLQCWCVILLPFLRFTFSCFKWRWCELMKYTFTYIFMKCEQFDSVLSCRKAGICFYDCVGFLILWMRNFQHGDLLIWEKFLQNFSGETDILTGRGISHWLAKSSEFSGIPRKHFTIIIWLENGNLFSHLACKICS